MIKVSSRVGPSHVRAGKPNEDAWFTRDFQEFTIAAVADGAGSLPRAKEGAEYASRWVVENAVNNLRLGKNPEEALDSAVEEAAQQVRELDFYENYGATLAACIRSNKGAWVKVIGDAFGVVSKSDGGLVLVRAKQRSPYPNVTTFLYHVNPETAKEAILGPGTKVFLCSDGFENVSLEGEELYGDFWGPLSELIEEIDLEELIDRMERDGKMVDDTTILAIY